MSSFRLHRPGIALALLLLLLAGCRSQPMLTPSPIHSPLGTEQNRLAILRGMMVRDWNVVSESPGRITARQDKNDVGRHVVTMDIEYDEQTILLRYRSSQGMLCEPAGDSCASIHRIYNRWIAQLAKDIEMGAQMTRLESPGAPPVGAGSD